MNEYEYGIKIIANESRTRTLKFIGYTYFLKEVIEFKQKESLCVWQKLIMEMYATAFKFKDELHLLLTFQLFVKNFAIK